MRIRRKRALLGAAIIAIIALTAGTLWLRTRDSARKASSDIRRDPKRRVFRTKASGKEGDPLAWLVEPGARPRRIAGKVVEDAARVDGARVDSARAVPGIVVELRGYETFLRGLEPPRSVTDEAGRFDFGEQPATTYMVIPLTPDKRRTLARVDLANPLRDPAPDQLVLRLRPCSRSIRGRVRDMAGNPIGGATVEATTNVGPYLSQVRIPGATTAADGMFALCTNIPYVVIAAKGYESVELTGDAPEGGFDVRLFPEAVVEGHVIDVEGKPMPGALVTLREAGFSHGRAPYVISTTSELDGSFRFEGVGPGDYSVSGDRADAREKNPSFAAEVHVTPSAHVTGVVVTMESCGRSLAGHVLDEGKPVAGATIAIGQKAITQSDGSFVLRCVPRAWRADETSQPEPVKVVVSEHDVLRPESIPDDLGSIDDLVVEVRSRGRIFGRVLRGGAPVEDATVGVGDPGQPVWISSSVGETYRAWSGKDGTYELRGIPAGEFEVSALHEETGLRSNLVTVAVKEREPRGPIDLELSRRGLVRGRIVNAAGIPVPSMNVWIKGDGLPKTDPTLEQAAAVSDASGAFAIKGLGKGRYHLQAKPLRGDFMKPEGQTTVVLPSDDAEVATEIRLDRRRSLTLTGTVIYDNDAPVGHAAVRSSSNVKTMTDAQGRFVLERVAEGKQQLFVSAPDGSKGEARDVDAGARDVSVRIDRAGNLEGQVEATRGPCIVNVTVAKEVDLEIPGLAIPTLDFLEKGYRLFTQAGSFRLHSIPAARYHVIANCDREGVATGSVTVVPAKTSRLSLRAGAPGKIRGTATRFPSGEPAKDLECQAGEDRSETDPSGSFALERVFPGAEVELACSSGLSPPMTTGKTTVSVRPGEVTTAKVFVVELRLGPDHKAGDLGAKLVLTTDHGQPALAFSEVEGARAAARAGIREGDVLLSVESADATGPAVEIVELYFLARAAGEPIHVTVSRGGHTLAVPIVMQARDGTGVPPAVPP